MAEGVLRMSIKKNLFPVQRVAIISASRAAVLFFFFFTFFVVGRVLTNLRPFLRRFKV